MSDLDRYRVERESRHRGTDLGHSTRYSAAIDRYLGVEGYRSGEVGPHPAESPAVVAVVAATAGTVLVGVDESHVSCTAVDHAAIGAELRGWDLRMVHAQHSGGSRSAARDAGSRLLERLADRVHACSPTVAVTSSLVIGSASSLLLAAARDADLVVVGHRHGAAGSAFGLSVGDRVAAQHPGTVPGPGSRVPGWPPGPGFGERPVVVGVEHLGTVTPATRFALEEARVRGCDLVILHAQPYAASAGRAEMIGGVRVHHRTVDADPAPAPLDFSNRAAAVVIGRRSLGAIPVTMLGSVGRAMVRHAYCPVFLVG